MPLLAALHEDADRPAVVATPDRSVARHELLGWATGLADRISGAPMVAVHAAPGLPTIAAVTAGLLAGVPVVPVPPDAGELERAHILSDSGAAVILSDDPAAAGASPVPVMAISDPVRPGAVPAEPGA